MISLGKLKERKLVQWALAYLAGAWLVLQLLDLLAQPFALPGLLLRIVTVLLAVGFFAALVIAWYHGERGAQRVGGIELLMLAAILLMAGAAVSFVYGRDETPADALLARGGEAAASVANPVAEQGSIAVLPFVNMSADPEQEYFSDGLTEELLNVLAQLPELRVASRTSAFSFKGKDVGIDSIARALRVAHVLEGSVRRSGDRARITAQLINARTGYHLWSETYDRKLTDVFAVQDEISRAIVNVLKLKLSGGRADARLAKEETRDPEAHALVLRGIPLMRQSTREGQQQAVELYRAAIRRDSAYARAYALLAMAYNYQAYMGYGAPKPLTEQARAAAVRALEIDPAIAEAHLALAQIAETHDWDFRAAEKHYRRAIELNPGLSTSRTRLGLLLIHLGRPEEALSEAKLATEMDPVSAGALGNLGFMYSLANQPERAVAAFKAALVLQPLNPVMHSNLAVAFAELGRDAEALAAAERARTEAPDEQYIVATLAYVHGRAGRREEAEQVIRSLEAMSEPSPYVLASAYAPLGDADRVFALLEKAVAEKEPIAPDLGVDPTFAEYRADARMRALLDRIGLP